MARLHVAALLSTVVALAAGKRPKDAFEELQDQAQPAWLAQMGKSATCNLKNMRVREEWGDLSKKKRREYIDAVLCLQELPSRHNPEAYPGAHSRYDDFVVVHIEQSLQIHNTGNFQSWHRYYTWAFEEALRNECGYKGTQPYWDYGRWAEDPASSPLFDGSDTSLSGNGALTNSSNPGTGYPHGTGGGCIESGPFKNMTAYLGPLSPTISPAPKPNPRKDGMGSNPRCMKRDITNYLTSNFGTTWHEVALTTNYTTVSAWQTALQTKTAEGDLGLHGVGHFTFTGDPSGDFYTSPNDPAFFVHHGMVDRLWTVWQGLDLGARLMAMEGGTEMMDTNGTSRRQTLDDTVDFRVLGVPVRPLRELMSVVDGPFCYYYA